MPRALVNANFDSPNIDVMVDMGQPLSTITDSRSCSDKEDIAEQQVPDQVPTVRCVSTKRTADVTEFCMKSCTEITKREGIHSYKMLPVRLQDTIKASVRQLKSINAKGFEENLGSIVFLQKEFAITCFHEVYHCGLIMEHSLRVDGQRLSHIVSFPYYDISFYKCPDRNGQSLELGNMASIGRGGSIYLASYISDSEEESNLVICNGTICSIKDDTVLGQYQCFPGSSSGAVLSSAGMFLGMHGVYHENSRVQPPDWFFECKLNDAIRTLKWGTVDCSGLGFCERSNSRDVAIYPAQNATSKGHLGRFLSIGIISIKLLEEGVLPAKSTRRRYADYPYK